MKEKKQMEMKAEEMRVLYVAMTRAKEHINIIASIKDLEKSLGKWQDAQFIEPTEMLPEYTRSRANSYLDWIGPAVARHPDFELFGLIDGGKWNSDPSKWSFVAIHTSSLQNSSNTEENVEKRTLVEFLNEKPNEELVNTITSKFDKRYPYESSVAKRTKQSVSELKRIAQLELEEEHDPFITSDDLIRPAYMHARPKFMSERTLSSAEIGTAMHTIMQHIDIQKPQTVETIKTLVAELLSHQLLTEEEAKVIRASSVVQFFESDIGRRLKNAQLIKREMPFTYGMKDDEGDIQIVQGIADCLFKEDDGWVLLDYKTDRVKGKFETNEQLENEMKNRYGIQLSLYDQAISEIMNINIKERVLYLFDGECSVTVQGEKR